MNKVYRIIWNASANCWTVASELARGRSKGRSCKKTDKTGRTVWNGVTGTWVTVPGQAQTRLKPPTANTMVTSLAMVLGLTGAGTAGASTLELSNEACPGGSGGIFTVGGTASAFNEGIAIGSGAKARLSCTSAATGASSIQWGWSSIAIGSNAQALSGGLALGYQAYASGADSLAFGVNTIAKGSRSVALGSGSSDGGRDNVVSVGLGNEILQKPPGASGSVPNANLAPKARQIINMAAGTQDTDAVNVSQLKGVTTALGGGATVAADGTVTAPSYVVQGSTFGNVGAALASLNTATTKNTGDITTLNTGTTVNTINNGGSRYFKTAGLNDGTDDAKASGKNAVALGANSVAERDNSVSVGRAEIKDGTGAVTQSGITRQITNVADGTQAKDAVNRGQLDGVNTAAAKAQTAADKTQSGLNTLDGLAAKYDSTLKDKLTLGGAGTSGTVTLGNVKDGVAATDAVNRGQLDAVNVALNTAVTKAQAAADKAQSGLNTLDGLAAKYDSTSKDRMTLGGAGTTGTVTLGNVRDGVAATDAVNRGQLDGVSTAAAKAQTAADTAQSGLNTLDGLAVKYDSTSKDRVTLGGAGTTGTVTLGNVKAGLTSNDAVNVSQLKPVVEALGGGATLDAKTGAVSGPSYAIQEGTYTTVGGALGKLDTATTKNTGDITTLNSAVDSIKGGVSKYAVFNSAGTMASASGADAVALGMGTLASGKNAVALGANSVAERDDSISVGRAEVKDGVTGTVTQTEITRQITNVADGTQAKDAVNRGQLDGVNTALTTAVTKAQAAADTAQSGLNTLDGLAAKYDSTSKDRLTLGGAGTTGTVTLGNVKDGVAATDAVNRGQLDGVNTAQTTAVTKAQAAADTVQSGLNTLDGLAVKYDSTSKDQVTLGGTGTTGTVTLGNVKAGLASNDAVNVSQLKPVVEALGGGATLDAKTGAVSGPSYAIQGSTYTTVGSALGKLDTATTKNTGDITTLNSAVDSIKGGVSKYAAFNSTDTLASASGADAVALGMGTLASGKNAVALGANSVAERDNSISVGRAEIKDGVTGNVTQTEITRQITNVADGTQAKDAVNWSQLDAVTVAQTTAVTKAQAAADTAQSGLNTLDSLAVKYDSTSKDQVTLGGTGTSGTVTLGNVKAGLASNDAVNVSQLKPVVDALGGGATLDAKTGAVSGPSYAIQGSTYTTVGSALDKLDTATTKNSGDITTLNSTVNSITGGVSKYAAFNSTGTMASASGADAVALGMGTLASGKNAVALGANSVAERDDSVSVGRAEVKDGATGNVTQTEITRQITNVADGTQAKDAVNKGQLDTVNTAAATAQTAADKAQAGLNTLDGLAVKYDSTSKDRVTLGGAGTSGTVTLGNVKAGLASNDAVNVSQLKPVVEALGGGATMDAKTGAVSGPSYAIQGSTFTTVGGALGKLDTATTKNTGDITTLNSTVNSITGGVSKYAAFNSTGALASASGADAVALGMGTLASGKNAVALGANSVAERDNSLSVGRAEIKDGVTGKVTQTEITRQITNVADGTQAKDAVNRGQLDGVSTTLTTAVTKAQAAADTAQSGLNTLEGLAVKYDSTSKDQVTLGGAGTTGTVTLGNVKAGLASNDAVNVSQLKPVVEALGGGATMDAKTGAVSGPSYAIQGSTFTTVGSALGKLDTATTKNTGDITTVNSTLNNLTSGTAGLVQQDATTKAITVASGTAGTSVNIAGTAGERQLKGVAAGTADTDGVNLKQLKGMGVTTDTAGNVTNAFVAYDSTSKDRVTLGGTGTTGTVTLGNVKDGVAATDAVNRGQLDVVSAVAAKNASDITTLNTTVNTVNNGGSRYFRTAGLNDGTDDAKASGKNSIAVGANSVADRDNSLSVGRAEIKDGVTGKVTQTEITRQITNVADGTQAKDAVNRGQLDGVNTALTTAVTKAQTAADTAQSGLNTLEGLAVKYDSTSKDRVTLGGAGTTGTVTLGNVKAGLTSNDAVNVSQLKPMVEALGGGATMDAKTGAVSGPSYAIQGGTYTTVGGALGKLDTATTKNTGDITTINSTLSNLTSGTAGLVQQDATTKAITVASGTAGTSVNIAGTAGERQLKGVAAGTADTDGVNLKQLQSIGLSIDAAGNVTNAFMAYDSTSKDRATLGGAGVTNTVALGNIKAGLTGNDAVNVSQLKPVVEALGGGAALDAKTGAVTGPSYTIQGNTYTTVGSALGKLDTATTKNTGDITSLSTTLNNLNTGTTGLVQQDATSLDLTVAKASGGNKVDFTGTAGMRVLTGVQAGELSAASHDAVNGAQLYATNTNVTKNSGDITALNTTVTQIANDIKSRGLGLVIQDRQTGDIMVAQNLGGSMVDIGGSGGPRVLTGVANGVNNRDVATIAQLKAVGWVDPSGKTMGAVVYDDLSHGQATLGGAGGTKLDNVANGRVAEGSREAVNGSQFYALQQSYEAQYNALSGKIGTFDGPVDDTQNRPASGGTGTDTGTDTDLVRAGTGNNGIVLSPPDSSALASGDQALALGAGAQASGANSVALGQGSIADEANVVSLGSEGHERRLGNIAPGVRETDVVNVGQLQQGLDGLRGDMNQMARHAYAGVAAAMAMPNLSPSGPGKTSVGGGIANYRGGNAVGVGLAYRTLNNKWRVQGAVSLTSTGSTSSRVQVDYAF
ncbi:ESPR-type extended signal peptide-containing protein [Paraburkholderia hayleyella]|uniref:ESPR-type extended signal peptide-containing protein n=1 Tax=Paraburkholderia hayleyella TaxID=2152889 RepID=UPI0012912A08|nr:ESPR-type extended signal peptide-containing protein [Paraburkholderia hayleyella]